MSNLYEDDFYAWTKQNAELIRQGRLSEVDFENIVEELEGMGRSEKRGFVSHLRILIAHLLKWQYQPEEQKRGWLLTIREQRLMVKAILKDNPSFKPLLGDVLDEAYGLAVILAMKETGLPENVFPASCPYGFDEIMDNDFLPEGMPYEKKD
jgi:hypothetical protein